MIQLPGLALCLPTSLPDIQTLGGTGLPCSWSSEEEFDAVLCPFEMDHANPLALRF